MTYVLHVLTLNQAGVAIATKKRSPDTKEVTREKVGHANLSSSSIFTILFSSSPAL